MPQLGEFEYTFGRLAEVIDTCTNRVGIDRYAMYLQDYGAPIGFRLAVKHTDGVRALVIQKGNAYAEGLRDFWEPLKAYWRDPKDAHRETLEQLSGTRSHQMAVHAWST